MNNDRIELVARALCENQGMDPDELVSHGFGDDMTDAEYAEHCNNSMFVPAILLTSPRWRLSRKSAAFLIAGEQALLETQPSYDRGWNDAIKHMDVAGHSGVVD